MPRMVYDPNQGRYVETTGIPNLTLEFLSRPKRIEHIKCRLCGQSFRLEPHNRDLPATHWQDNHCNRQITLQEMRRVWDDVCKTLMKDYNLSRLHYDVKTGGWGIQSNEWQSPSDRLEATRRRLSDSQKDIIKEELMDEVANRLLIEFSEAQEYWLEV